MLLSVVDYSIFLYSLNIVLVGKAMTDEILTLQEVAEYLKLAEKTAYRLAAEGKLPGFKVGGSWRFRAEDIDRWIEKQKKRVE
jgi:excisionase family DNA binding protein